MAHQVLTNFRAITDTGLLHTAPGEYSFLQNLRGWGGKGSKRRGVKNYPTPLDSGIMGIFDLKIDGDVLSPDKIIVVTGNGDFVLYDFSELISVFDFLFDTGIGLDLQSPNLNWWSIAPTTGGSGGIMTATSIAAPATTISADLYVGVNELFGFQDSTGIWRLRIDDSNPAIPVLGTSRYSNASANTEYATAPAFTNGFGPIFQTTNLVQYRYQIDNSGITFLEQI